jgi:adenosylhomocysteine nucleosidase
VREIAIICALEAEVRPLIKRREWRVRPAGGTGRSFESSDAVVVCAGIGARAARRAAEAVIAAERPRVLVSAGFAGALTPGLKGGALVVPEVVVSGAEGSQFVVRRYEGLAADAGGTLVSAQRVAGREGKAELAERFRAQAVDMEAATVAEVAREHGLGFLAIKAISDEFELRLPDLNRFVDAVGRFHTARFVLHAALRPSLWIAVSRLASNQARASETLCRALLRLLPPASGTAAFAGDAESARRIKFEVVGKTPERGRNSDPAEAKQGAGMECGASAANPPRAKKGGPAAILEFPGRVKC